MWTSCYRAASLPYTASKAAAFLQSILDLMRMCPGDDRAGVKQRHGPGLTTGDWMSMYCGWYDDGFGGVASIFKSRPLNSMLYFIVNKWLPPPWTIKGPT